MYADVYLLETPRHDRTAHQQREIGESPVSFSPDGSMMAISRE